MASHIGSKVGYGVEVFGIVSTQAAKAGGLDTAGLEQRSLELRGRAETVDAWVAA